MSYKDKAFDSLSDRFVLDIGDDQNKDDVEVSNGGETDTTLALFFITTLMVRLQHFGIACYYDDKH